MDKINTNQDQDNLYIKPIVGDVQIEMAKGVGIDLYDVQPSSDYYLARLKDGTEVFVKFIHEPSSRKSYIKASNEKSVSNLNTLMKPIGGILGNNITIPKILLIQPVMNPKSNVEEILIVSETLNGISLFDLLMKGEVSLEVIKAIANFIYNVQRSTILKIATFKLTIAKIRRTDVQWNQTFKENALKWSNQLTMASSSDQNLSGLSRTVSILFGYTSDFNISKTGRSNHQGRPRAGNTIINMEKNEVNIGHYNWEDSSGGNINYYTDASVIGELLWRHNLPLSNTVWIILNLIKCKLDLMITPQEKMHFILYFRAVLSQRILGDLTDIIFKEKIEEGLIIKYIDYSKTKDGLSVDIQVLLANIANLFIGLDSLFSSEQRKLEFES